MNIQYNSTCIQLLVNKLPLVMVPLEGILIPVFFPNASTNDIRWLYFSLIKYIHNSNKIWKYIWTSTLVLCLHLHSNVPFALFSLCTPILLLMDLLYNQSEPLSILLPPANSLIHTLTKHLLHLSTP